MTCTEVIPEYADPSRICGFDRFDEAGQATVRAHWNGEAAPAKKREAKLAAAKPGAKKCEAI
jgi:hypothetical protein